MSVRVFAPAKINLTLHVGAPRQDGMHPLQSVVVFADVGDWVEAAPADNLHMRGVSGRFGDAALMGDDNLMLRAARRLADAAGIKTGAALSLEKNLPLASGIGGGSADAAAALKALRTLWALQLDDADLARIGAEIGADVPVCVAGRAAWMTGVGERVAPMQAPDFDAVLINPGAALPTADVFRAFDTSGAARTLGPDAPPHWSAREQAIEAIAKSANDLEAPARGLMPEIAQMREVLRADPRVLYAGLSGSGATMFALTAARAASLALAEAIARAHPHWWVQPARLNA